MDGAKLDDEVLSRAIRGSGGGGRPVRTAIDAPFGWPEPFVEAVAAHHRLEPWPVTHASLARRTTDDFVHRRAHKLPLSVSTDRIAYCAIRCAAILGDVARHLGADLVARDGSGLVVEGYPDAALRCWLPELWAARAASYKGDGEPAEARREAILAALLRGLGPAFAVAAAEREACVRSDDCLDALVCALVARAAQRGDTIAPASAEHRRLARTEGWIHLPVVGSLDRLV